MMGEACQWSYVRNVGAVDRRGDDPAGRILNVDRGLRSRCGVSKQAQTLGPIPADVEARGYRRSFWAFVRSEPRRPA